MSDIEALARHANGEAWMMCLDCGSRLYSFDGHQDDAISCPEKVNNGNGGFDCLYPPKSRRG